MSVVNKEKMLNQGAKQVNSNTNNKTLANFNKNTGSSANSTPHRNPNFGGNKQDANSPNRSNKEKVVRGNKQTGNKNLSLSNMNDWPKPGAPIFDIPVKEKSKDSQKFTGRCRVFVANLPTNISEEALKKLFEQFGEVSEVFLGKGNSFAFVKMDTRANAESARAALDSKTYEGKTLRVRLAAHAAALRVKNLSSTVTNELLEYAFARFGEIERAVVITDYRGRSTGEGIVEFARKASAQNALKRCTNECFFITSMPKPVYVEPFEQKDDEEGFPEKHVNKHQPEFAAEREVGPRFGEPGTFECEFGMRWKQLFDIEKQKQERLEEEIQEARKILQEQMEYSRVEHQTNMLREQLRQMEEQSTKYAQIQNNRMEDDRRRGEERQRQEMVIRQQTEDVLRMKGPQDMYHLKRQENELRSKANALQDLLERQEQSLNQFSTGMGHAPVPDPMYSNRLGQPVNDLGGHQPAGVMQGSASIQPPMQQFQGNLGVSRIRLL